MCLWYNCPMGLKKLKTLLVILLVLCVSVLIIAYPQFKKGSSKYYELQLKHYKQGLEFYYNNDFQNAYYNFARVSPFSDLALNALYRQAKSADKQNDTKTAIKKYSLCAKKIKDENITPFFLWRIAQLRLKEGNKKLAKKTFHYIKNKYPNSEYGIAVNYQLAQMEKDTIVKKKYLLEYIKNSPKGRFSMEIVPMLLDNYDLNFEEKLIIAESLYQNGEYKKATNILKDVPLSMSWIEFLKSLDKLNSSKNILKIARKGFTFYNSDFSADDLDFAVSTYIKHSDRKLKAADEIYTLSDDPAIKGGALYRSLSYTTGEDNYRRKLILIEKYKEYKQAPTVLFNVFMENCLSGNKKLAMKYGKIHLANYKDQKTTPAVLYFMAYLKNKDSDSSYKTTASTLLNEYPHSYYAMRAYTMFADKKPIKPEAIRPADRIDFPYTTNKKLADFFEQLARDNDTEFLIDFRLDDPLIESWVQHKKGDRALSTVIARNYISEHAESAPKSAYQLAYPLYYTEKINKYSKQNNINPYLILALMKEESHFEPNIRSAVGATGLMQLMPSTAAMIAGRYYSSSELTNEETNISLGTAYFAYLMKMFQNKEELCVLSYNSGPYAVKKWLKDKASLPFDFMVETIPYSETKEYIKKVYTTYWNYLLTYEDIKIGSN